VIFYRQVVEGRSDSLVPVLPLFMVEVVHSSRQNVLAYKSNRECWDRIVEGYLIPNTGEKTESGVTCAREW
jgi:hypothetical protein